MYETIWHTTPTYFLSQCDRVLICVPLGWLMVSLWLVVSWLVVCRWLAVWLVVVWLMVGSWLVVS